MSLRSVALTEIRSFPAPVLLQVSRVYTLRSSRPPFSRWFCLLAGERLGGLLVKGKLAACVNMVPRLTSIYE